MSAQPTPLEAMFHPDAQASAEPFDTELAALIGLAAEPAVPPSSLRDRLLSQVRREKSVRRPALREEFAGIHVLRAGNAAWKPTQFPGIFSQVLFVDKSAGLCTSLMKIEPGGSYPSHRHAIEEQTYVITGDLKIGDVHLDAGDFSTAAPGTTHGVITSEQGCIALVVASIHDEIFV
jgi:anti-sigma factor ChrR (cupin superfamily)